VTAYPAQHPEQEQHPEQPAPSQPGDPTTREPASHRPAAESPAVAAAIEDAGIAHAGADVGTPQLSWTARVIIAPIRFYQLNISPMRLPTCRYAPTCSEYAVEALRLHGGVRGGWLAIRRLLRCHPWHRGGHDPVPETVGRRTARQSSNTPRSRQEPPGA
jgi:putative membrane protein insertion efficiency factor